MNGAILKDFTTAGRSGGGGKADVSKGKIVALFQTR